MSAEAESGKRSPHDDLNYVFLSGVLAQDPVVRYLPPEGTPHCEVTLREGENEFLVFLAGDDAEHLSTCADEGYRVLVTGRLKQQEWKVDHGRVSRTRVIVESTRTRVIATPAGTMVCGKDVP